MTKDSKSSLIRKYLQKQCSPQERAQLDQWYLQAGKDLPSPEEVDYLDLEQEIWAGIKGKAVKKRVFPGLGWAAAALVFLSLGIGFYLGILLEDALDYVEQAYAEAEDYPVGIIRYFPETGYIPSYVADKAAKIEGVRGDLKALEGRILTMLGRQDAAGKAMEIAAEKATEKETILQVADYYQENQASEKAFQLYKEIYLKSPMDAEVQAGLKRSYQALPNKQAGFEQMRADLDTQWKGALKDELRAEMIEKPLPAMHKISNLQGEPVDITALKGKVLVIDFWATWCVPCLASFPYMQKVYDRYKDRDDVAFLIVNTGSNNTLEDARNWKQKAEYTFPVYYNGDPEMLSGFGVNMIPASFVVDKNQQIRFSTIGFEGEILEAKLGLMLELVLQE